MKKSTLILLMIAIILIFIIPPVGIFGTIALLGYTLIQKINNTPKEP